MTVGYEDKRAITLVENINDALIRILMYDTQAKLSVPLLQYWIDCYNDGYLTDDDHFLISIYTQIRDYLQNKGVNHG